LSAAIQGFALPNTNVSLSQGVSGEDRNSIGFNSDKRLIVQSKTVSDKDDKDKEEIASTSNR
jgi:hypothetical protein